jgi:hypothetical protein
MIVKTSRLNDIKIVSLILITNEFKGNLSFYELDGVNFSDVTSVSVQALLCMGERFFFVVVIDALLITNQSLSHFFVVPSLRHQSTPIVVQKKRGQYCI